MIIFVAFNFTFCSVCKYCRRFFRSPNFEGWYHQRQREVNQKLQILHLEALSSAVSLEFLREKGGGGVFLLLFLGKEQILYCYTEFSSLFFFFVKTFSCVGLFQDSLILSSPQFLIQEFFNYRMNFHTHTLQLVFNHECSLFQSLDQT